MVDISILYDNTACVPGLEADWGFAALIETSERRILFDAGGDGQILLSNAASMGIDLSRTDTIFVSHNHFDHIGGLSAAVRACPDAQLFIPVSLRGVKRVSRVTKVSGEVDLGDGFRSTGELDSVEQSLLIRTPAGIVVVVGCSHPGLERILSVAQRHGHVHGVLGGLHGFDDYGILGEIDFVCPTHCTVHTAEIRSLFPGKYLPGGAGRCWTFPVEKGPTDEIPL